MEPTRGGTRPTLPRLCLQVKDIQFLQPCARPLLGRIKYHNEEDGYTVVWNGLNKHELLNNLFVHPYTKIEFIQQDMLVQRKTATKYLDMIVETGLLEKVKIKHTNYYMNVRLIELFMNRELPIENNNTEIIESISSV